MSILEEIECWSNEVPVGNENLKNAVEVFRQRFATELQHAVEGFEGFFGQISFTIDSDQVREEGRSDGL